jgi:hypothetical protein
MKLKVDRKWKKDTYTIGRLFINGEFFCNTLEDTDRGLKQSDPLVTIQKKKVYGETAIPTGIYKLEMNVVSPKYSLVKWYQDLCKGKMPRLLNVPGFEGVLIHPGNTPLDTFGCVLVGDNKVKGKLVNSRERFKELYKKLRIAADNNEEITIEIV